MLFCGLAAILVIMINGIIPTGSTSSKAIGHKAAESTRAHIRSFPDENNLHKLGSGRLMEKNRNWCLRVQWLDSVFIKLRNVINKYDLKQEELKSLYTGVTHCGLNNCGEFRVVTPENKIFKCRKIETQKDLKNQTNKRLLYLHGGVQNFEKTFKRLIKFEKLPEFEIRGISNGSRLAVLKEFQTDLKTLKKKILEVTKKQQRLHFPPEIKMKRPISQTDLMIHEWRTIQQSKDFLMKSRVQLEKVFKCWKRRKGVRSFRKYCGEET